MQPATPPRRLPFSERQFSSIGLQKRLYRQINKALAPTNGVRAGSCGPYSVSPDGVSSSARIACTRGSRAVTSFWRIFQTILQSTSK
ncbi:hypothetical protein DSECCO2_615840 [anaerobic digester metagenome]